MFFEILLLKFASGENFRKIGQKFEKCDFFTHFFAKIDQICKFAKMREKFANFRGKLFICTVKGFIYFYLQKFALSFGAKDIKVLSCRVVTTPRGQIEFLKRPGLLRVNLRVFLKLKIAQFCTFYARIGLKLTKYSYFVISCTLIKFGDVLEKFWILCFFAYFWPFSNFTKTR